jgi:hypothetical protein
MLDIVVKHIRLATLQQPLTFNSHGLLRVGDYQLTLSQLSQSLLVVGPGDRPWDAKWRLHLVNNLAILVQQLWKVGIDRIFVDGSFTEDKPHPNDIDGYFECDQQHIVSGELHKELNQLDPHKIWTWDPKARFYASGSGKPQLPMWHVYRVELYPHFGQGTNIRDHFGNDQTFPAAFRKSRDGLRRKGIIQIIQ